MKNIAVITPISHLEGLLDLLKTKGKVFLYEEANKQEVRKLLLQYNIDTLLCNPNQQTYIIDEELLNGTSIKIINTCSTGMNHIDTLYCKNAGIEILSLTKDIELIRKLPSTSELAFGLMTSLLRKIPQSITHVSNYGWDYTQFIGRQIKDLNIGIVGYGRLGKMMHNFCIAFNANTMIYDPYQEIPYAQCEARSLQELCQFSDVLTLHVHVTDETKYMINKEILGYMKENSYIINTSRGEIVDEQAIVNALKNNKIAGYGTDVIENEFDDLTKSPIISAMNEGENIIVTPHVGGMTIEGQTKAYKWAINKL